MTNPQAVSAAKPRQRAMTYGPSGARTFSLAPPEAPTERSFGAEILPLIGFSGTPEALAAARAGDLKRLDEHELAWLNAWGPKPMPPEDVPVKLIEKNGWRLYALEILHGGDRTMIKWGYRMPCPRCGRRVVPDNHCRRCGGFGYLHTLADDTIWIFQTDTDLNVGDIDWPDKWDIMERD